MFVSRVVVETRPRVSRGQRTNLLPCSAEVLFTRSAALIATSCIMDKRTEPWEQG